MPVGKDLASRLNRRVRIERPVVDEAFDGAGSGSWAEVATVYAEVRDVAPTREQLDQGVNLATRPARVLMRPRPDVLPSMRLVMGTRLMQIVGGPFEPSHFAIGEAMEFAVEDYSTAGNPA